MRVKEVLRNISPKAGQNAAFHGRKAASAPQCFREGKYRLWAAHPAKFELGFSDSIARYPTMAKRTPDLFDNAASGGSKGYTAKDIEVLEGLEPVRRRPGMYIGGTDLAAMHHLASEILDN